MMPLLGIFLQVWDVKEQFSTGKKLVYEIEKVDDKKVKSF